MAKPLGAGMKGWGQESDNKDKRSNFYQTVSQSDLVYFILCCNILLH